MNLQQLASRTDEQIISDLILDLSLVTAAPIGAGKRDLIRATAAANSMARITSEMDIKDLRTFEWTVEPLVRLLLVDIEDPLAAKVALALKSLMSSRICMSRLIDSGGLGDVAKVLDILLSKKTNELKSLNTTHAIVENLGVCYREIARFHAWKLVEVGGLRHCVAMLRYGDVTLQTISAMTMASLSNDLEICKQMFAYGAIKPLLNVSDANVTNDACMLAGLGCITQLCRIPEIAMRLVQQGVVGVLETALHRTVGHNHILIREKALYALGFLSRIDNLKAKLCTSVMLQGLMNEFHSGTLGSKTTILQLLMNVHNKYPQEHEIALNLRESVMHLLKTAPWATRNLCLKVFCVVYREMEDRVYFAHHGLVETIFEIIAAKSMELQETPMVAFLNLCEHPQLPFMMIRRGVVPVVVKMLQAPDVIIKELAIVLLKAFLLYNQDLVMREIPQDKHYLMKRDIYNPQNYGAEYGGMIQEFLQIVVDNRRAQDYLINQFNAQDLDDLALTKEDLVEYQNTFMEIDVDCSGTLSADELKMLMVVMGEEMDREELQELLEEYDTDKSGELDFREFVIMMKGWNTRFGTGFTRWVNITTKRGPIGKSIRTFKRWLNKDALEAAHVQEARERRRAENSKGAAISLQYLPTERLKQQREIAMKLRAEEKYLSSLHDQPGEYEGLRYGTIYGRSQTGSGSSQQSSPSARERRGSAVSHLTFDDTMGFEGSEADDEFNILSPGNLKANTASKKPKRRVSIQSIASVSTLSLPPIGASGSSQSSSAK